MARIAGSADGAEHGHLLYFTTTTGVTNITTNPRSGARNYRISGNSYARKAITAISDVYFRIGIYMSNVATAYQFLVWDNAGTILGSIRLNTSTYKLEAYTSTGTLVATGSAVLAALTYYLLEVHVSIADSGVIQVKLEGSPVLDIDYAGDTKPGAATSIDRFSVVSVSSGAGVLDFDDIALDDATWCGDGKILGGLPNANGDASDMVGADGDSINNYLQTNSVPYDVAKYVKSKTTDAKDLYNVATVTIPTDAVVTHVWVEGVSLEETAGGDSEKLGLKTHSVEYFDSGHVQTTSYARYVGTDHAVNPQTGVAWTQSDLDDLQIGEKIG